MQIRVITKARSRFSRVIQLTESIYEVSVAAAPIQGKANEAVVEELAKYFGLHKNQIRLVAGATAKNKTFEIG